MSFPRIPWILIASALAGALSCAAPAQQAPASDSAGAAAGGTSSRMSSQAPRLGEPLPPSSLASAKAKAAAPPARVDEGVANAAGKAGATTAVPTAAPEPRRFPHGMLTSIAYKTWIWSTPNTGGQYLGFMRIGQRIALRSADKVVGQGCARGFLAVEPRGYVCQDRTVTREAETPFLRANEHTLPQPGAYPYQYALSNGAPMYARVPDRDEQRRYEARYGKVGEWIPLPQFSAGHEHLALNTPIPAADAMPSFLQNGMGARGKPLVVLKRSLPHGSMMAYTRAFEAAGRTYLLSADLTVVPADRVRRFRHSRFAGVRLGADNKLPLAWFRKKPRSKYRLLDGVMKSTGESFPVRTHAPLSGAQQRHKGKVYHEVSPTGSGIYTAAEDATIVRHYGKRPFGVKPGEKWIMVSILNGTLVAYDDLTPIFTTLVSPGQGGLPRKGGDSVKDSTTPLGSYRITFKDVAATMSPEMGSNRSFWIADVPHTQYFNAPFALHGAYWHEKFGEPMSAGCVNLSPLDAHWLFGWSDPQVPPGWQGAAGIKANGATTAVIIVR